ncbi:MAG: hypothetical protein CVV05_12995 [Gammaproteobacteria bacterium HGW-Gammaproteobacteria-1]|jgi:hypothetical protein|nr:MAG: hypothetical protein CVV05_12995 [Gammaproteobacteria bacterium HGW-Gammaproteobacteria-1]
MDLAREVFDAAWQAAQNRSVAPLLRSAPAFSFFVLKFVRISEEVLYHAPLFQVGVIATTAITGKAFGFLNFNRLCGFVDRHD